MEAENAFAKKVLEVFVFFFAFFPLGFLGCFWPKRWCYATAITNESTERPRARKTEEAEVGRGKRRSKTIEQIFNKAQNCSIFLLFAYLICFEVFFTRCVRVSSPVCLCQPASLSLSVCMRVCVCEKTADTTVERQQNKQQQWKLCAKNKLKPSDDSIISLCEAAMLYRSQRC